MPVKTEMSKAETLAAAPGDTNAETSAGDRAQRDSSPALRV